MSADSPTPLNPKVDEAFACIGLALWLPVGFIPDIGLSFMWWLSAPFIPIPLLAIAFHRRNRHNPDRHAPNSVLCLLAFLYGIVFLIVLKQSGT